MRVVEVRHPGLPTVAHEHLKLVGAVQLSKFLRQVACDLGHKQDTVDSKPASDPALEVCPVVLCSLRGPCSQSTWSLPRVCMESTWSLHGVYTESTQNLHGVYTESTESAMGLTFCC